MDSGSYKALYILLAVVIFGIFLSLSYWLFQDQLKVVTIPNHSATLAVDAFETTVLITK